MTATTPAFCTCGEPEPHRISRRQTADGKDVVLWSDGAVTGAFGHRLAGVPMRRPRTVEAANLARRVGWLVLGEACIHDTDELGDLYTAARRAVEQGDGEPGTMRANLAALRARRVAPVLQWVVTATDRDGRPTEREARLPRLRWPGLHVLDFCGGPGSAGGRYRLFREGRGDGPLAAMSALPALFDTGHAFRRLADLWAHLATEGLVSVGDVGAESEFEIAELRVLAPNKPMPPEAPEEHVREER